MATGTGLRGIEAGVMTIAHGGTRPRRPRAPTAGEWKSALGIGIAWCSSVLFTIGLLVAGWGVGSIAWDVWQNRREEQAATNRARAPCAASPHDPTVPGTPAQQIESCIRDATDGYGQGIHPALAILGSVAAFYLVMTGSIAWAAGGYWMDQRGANESPGGRTTPR